MTCLTDPTSSDACLPHELFHAADLPVHERFPVWREAVAPLFDCAPLEDASQFTAELEGYDLGRTFLSICSFAPLHYRREPSATSSQVDHLLVQLYLSGGYVGENGAQAMRVEAGDISLLDLAAPLATQTQASRVLTVVIPREVLAHAASRRPWTPGTVLRAGSPMANILGNHLWTVWRNLPRASRAEVETINQLVAGVIASAFGAHGSCDSRAADITARATAEAIIAYIEQRLGSDSLTPAHLCRHFGVSRSQLYRMFEGADGVAGLIRRMRLARCRDELMSPRATDIRIIDVAVRWGFDNQSHFCRSFKQAFDMTPSEALEHGRRTQQEPLRRTAARTRQIPAFHRWLSELRAS